jgi:hypothetical protein
VPPVKPGFTREVVEMHPIHQAALKRFSLSGAILVAQDDIL